MGLTVMVLMCQGKLEKVGDCRGRTKIDTESLKSRANGNLTITVADSFYAMNCKAGLN